MAAMAPYYHQISGIFFFLWEKYVMTGACATNGKKIYAGDFVQQHQYLITAEWTRPIQKSAMSTEKTHKIK